jgi:hypothetical protein
MLQQENKNAIFSKSFTIGLIFMTFTNCTSSFLLRPVMAAQLTAILLPTSNIASTQTSYEIFFTTAHAGIIAKITIAFPQNSSATPRGFLVDSPILIDTRDIGAGKIKGYNNGTMLYTLTSPVSVRNGTSIRLEIANITNISYPGNFHVKMTTSDLSGKIIDTSLTSVRNHTSGGAGNMTFVGNMTGEKCMMMPGGNVFNLSKSAISFSSKLP